jgi:hypothetical protein
MDVGCGAVWSGRDMLMFWEGHAGSIFRELVDRNLGHTGHSSSVLGIFPAVYG